jgi:hypothetical protein
MATHPHLVVKTNDDAGFNATLPRYSNWRLVSAISGKHRLKSRYMLWIPGIPPLVSRDRANCGRSTPRPAASSLSNCQAQTGGHHC